MSRGLRIRIRSSQTAVPAWISGNPVTVGSFQRPCKTSRLLVPADFQQAGSLFYIILTNTMFWIFAKIIAHSDWKTSLICWRSVCINRCDGHLILGNGENEPSLFTLALFGAALPNLCYRMELSSNPVCIKITQCQEVNCVNSNRVNRASQDYVSKYNLHSSALSIMLFMA